MIYYGDALVCKLIKNIGLFKKNFEHIGLCEWTILLPEDMCYKLKIAEPRTGYLLRSWSWKSQGTENSADYCC